MKKPEFTRLLLACVLVVLSVSELLYLFLGWNEASVLGCLAFVGLSCLLSRWFAVREWVMVAIALAVLTSLLVVKDDAEAVLFALQRASFFAAFIYLVTLLKEAAQQSPSILKLGEYLTRQPRRRRYYALAGGGHVLGVLLNFGAISLLTPLIQRGARAASEDPKQIYINERRQISALLRGFSWMIMWSPTALTQAVLFTTFPDIDLGIVIPLGISAGIVMILIGRAEDIFHWRKIDPASAGEAPALPRKAAQRFFVVCLLLASLTYFVVWKGQVTAAIALMLVAPVVMVGWLLVQQFRGKIGEALLGALNASRSILAQSSVPLGRSAFTLGAAGFIGEAAAKLAPVSAIADVLKHLDMPVWLFLAVLPILITLGGQIALSPILVVVFLGAIINALPTLPADPNLIVFSLGCGWALSMTASPNASATLLISGLTKIPPTILTWRWNGLYSLLCFCAFTLSFFFLSLWFPPQLN